MKYRPHTYKFIVTSAKVIAISSYAGKAVRGVAKCHPNDNFDVEYGKSLAAARCNEKICKKRMKRATQKLAEATESLNAALVYYDKMKHYYMDSSDNLARASEIIETHSKKVKK